jgi:hypothetical protein
MILPISAFQVAKIQVWATGTWPCISYSHEAHHHLATHPRELGVISDSSCPSLCAPHPVAEHSGLSAASLSSTILVRVLWSNTQSMTLTSHVTALSSALGGSCSSLSPGATEKTFFNGQTKHVTPLLKIYQELPVTCKLDTNVELHSRFPSFWLSGLHILCCSRSDNCHSAAPRLPHTSLPLPQWLLPLGEPTLG